MRLREGWVRSAAGAAAPLTVIAAIALVFLPLTKAYDLDVFLRAGCAVLHGSDVYPDPASSAVYSGSSFVYPYLAAAPFAPLAALTRHLSTMLFFGVSAGAVLAACLVGARGDPWPAVLVLCTTFTITGLQLGALSPLLFAGVVTLWRLRERPLAVAVLAAPVIASKLFLAPLLAWLLLSGRYRAFAYASASTAALLAAGFLLGPLDPAQYLQLLSRLGAHEARAGFGFVGALMNLGLGPGVAQGSAFVLGAGILAAAHLHWRRAREERVLFCAGLIVSLVVTPVVWSHYLVLLPAVLLALNAPRRWLAALALASWAIALPHGVRLDTDLIEGVSSSASWPAVAVALAVLGYATSPRRAHLRRNPHSPRWQ